MLILLWLGQLGVIGVGRKSGDSIMPTRYESVLIAKAKGKNREFFRKTGQFFRKNEQSKVRLGISRLGIVNAVGAGLNRPGPAAHSAAQTFGVESTVLQKKSPYHPPLNH